MFTDAPAAKWARGGEVLAAKFTAQEAEFFTFQVGLFANGLAAADVSVVFHGGTLTSAPANSAELPMATIPAEAFTCFNTGGTDQHGQLFKKVFSLGAGDSGSLWIGVDLPVGAAGTYAATLSVATNTSAARTLTATIEVAPGAVAEHGDGDVYNLSRLRWLDSKIGVDESAEWPRSRFANMTSEPEAGGGFTLGLVNKHVSIGADGLPAQVTVHTVKQRQGKNITRSVSILASPVQLRVLDAAGKPITVSVTTPATVTNRSAAAVKWTATLSGGGVDVTLTGRLEMDSYLTFQVRSLTPPKTFFRA